jgi:Spy/CpxP family protein refolding chaperone
MRSGVNWRHGLVGLIVAGLLLAPSLVQAKGKEWQGHKAKILQQLNLSQDQTKKMEQIDEKYAKARKDILKDLKKNQEDLKKALAEKKPDEAKIKGLVSNINSEQDKLINTFKSQRDDELSIMQPIQQGKFLVALGEWRHEMVEKYKEKTGKK